MIKRGYFSAWYRKHGRSFPWRNTHITPFQLLVTEVLLRQTRAMAVARVWEDVLREYSSPYVIAAAQHSNIVAKLQHLGFGNQRTAALLAISKTMISTYNGEVPRRLESLLALPHVGQYIANAIRCFAFGKRVAIVDTNILRFFSRYRGIRLTTYDVRRNQWVWEDASMILPKRQPYVIQHNYGLLDFCAQVCKPRNPCCDACGLSSMCRQQGTDRA